MENPRLKRLLAEGVWRNVIWVLYFAYVVISFLHQFGS